MGRNDKLKYQPYQIDEKNVEDQLLLNYMDIAMKIYVWDNLPSSVTSYVIERALFWGGMCVFFEDKNLGYLALPPVVYKYINVYGLPQQYAAQGLNGHYFGDLNPDNSVLIKNSPNYRPTWVEVDRLCKELANVYQARKINVNASKTPFIIKGDEKELLSMKNMFEQISGNSPVVYKNKNKASTDIDLDTVDTSAEYIGDKLTALKNDIKCEILTYLGLNNSNVEKRERLVTDEVNANNDEIENFLFLRLEERKLACDAINKMFGLNIQVNINKEYLKKYGIILDDTEEKNEKKEEEQDNE